MAAAAPSVWSVSPRECLFHLAQNDYDSRLFPLPAVGWTTGSLFRIHFSRGDHPCWRSSSSFLTAGRHSFKAHDGLVDLIAFLAEHSENEADVHCWQDSAGLIEAGAPLSPCFLLGDMATGVAPACRAILVLRKVIPSTIPSVLGSEYVERGAAGSALR